MGNLGEYSKPCISCGYDFTYKEQSQVTCGDCNAAYYVKQLKEKEELNG
jgi:uncharacterized Zn ribbon protein